MVDSDFDSIFSKLRALFEHYHPPFTVRNESSSRYELWSQKPVEAFGRKRDEIYFGGVIIQKGFVGFYFMCLYMNDEFKATLPPELLKLLKGKACFHIKKLDDTLLKQIESTLEEGFKLYQEREWV